ncbi:hypothetical protein QDY63_14645 [Pseudomonas brenneri]|uniref:hypothetical protein n=1 Tax=Pseudomonas brenneri TaxID=129817 RepID=UPI0025A25DB5|nr:hypothetical protein [Pseudomonas brenneri]WJM94052.1 hypothetical protein QDY63_14645 [Pseudomonas brenneri]
MSFDFKEVLIDGDLLVYACCSAAEYGNELVDVQLDKILESIDSKIVYIKNRVNAEKVRVFFSGSSNFRFVVMPEYKANREFVERPYYLQAAIAYATYKWDAEMVDCMEADDLMCIHQDTKTFTTIIATIDKDMLQCRGHHYRWETVHQGEKFAFVTQPGMLEIIHKVSSTTGKITKAVKGNGPLFLCWQLLTGDPTDGIMGCGVKETKIRKTGKNAGELYDTRVGVGAVTAYELLANCESYGQGMGVVRKEYRKVFGDDWEAALLKQGRCLYMVTRYVGEHHLQLWHHDTSRFNESIYDMRTQEFNTPVAMAA